MLGTYADIHDRKAMEQERKRAMEVISAQNGRYAKLCSYCFAQPALAYR
jgi:hypothetical protein